MKHAVMLLALIATGCASMTTGRYQQVPVDSFPSGAKVAVNCGDAPHDGGATPATIKLQRGAEHCAVVLTKDGYAARTVEFDRLVSPVMNGNIASNFIFEMINAFGSAFIGVDPDDVYEKPEDGVDYATSAYKYKPAKVFVTLVRLEQAPPQ